jgi:hypothetical protein
MPSHPRTPQFFRGFFEAGWNTDSSMDNADVFDLIEELHHIAPNILLYVVPYLESQLEVCVRVLQ